MRSSSVSVFVVCLVALGVAQASQIGHRPVSLEALATSSAAVARVVVSEPASVTVDVPVAPDSGKACAASPTVRYSAAVVEVVRVRDGVTPPSGSLEFWAADGHALRRMSEQACVEGLRRGAIFDTYKESSGELSAGREVLVFLDHVPGWGWELAASGAWEEPAASERIRAATAP